jgi:linearmycin/streptolysin S transport system ATP-binding protein
MSIASLTMPVRPSAAVERNRASVTTAIPESSSTATVLEVSHLRKSFGGTVAVDDLSFRVAAGEILGLVGPNGAGKSTTMMIVAGARQADSGTVTIAGNAAGRSQQAVNMLLGVVPQDLAVYSDLTARENLEFFGDIYGVPDSELKRRIERVLAQVGLQSHADQLVRTFSGGMKRRLNFGVALIHEPRFVILDEPTVGIDPQSRSHILDCVRQLADDGVGVIYASHYMEEVEAICHKVAIVDHGRLLAQGTLDELVDKSRTDLFLRVAGPQIELQHRLQGLANVFATSGDESRVVIKHDGQALPGVVAGRLAQVVELLETAEFEILSIETHKPSLERLFLELTGRQLRD